MKRGGGVRVEFWVKELAEIIGVDGQVIQDCVDVVAKQNKMNRSNVIEILQAHFRPDVISALPIELRFMILQGLSAKDIVSFCASSKDNIYLCDDPKLWSSLISRDFGQYDLNHLRDKDPKTIYSTLAAVEEMYQKIYGEFQSLDDGHDNWDRTRDLSSYEQAEVFASTFLSLAKIDPTGQIFWTLMESTGLIKLAKNPGWIIGLAVLFAKIFVNIAIKRNLVTAERFSENMPSSIDFQLVLSYVPIMLAELKAEKKIKPRLFQQLFDWYMAKVEERGMFAYLDNRRDPWLPGGQLLSDAQYRLFHVLAKKIKLELIRRIAEDRSSEE
jgi:hypothetical protein